MLSASQDQVLWLPAERRCSPSSLQLHPVEPDDFVGEVVIKTEVNEFHLTVSARVVASGSMAGGSESPLKATGGTSPPIISKGAGFREDIALDETKSLEEVLGQQQPPIA